MGDLKREMEAMERVETLARPEPAVPGLRPQPGVSRRLVIALHCLRRRRAFLRRRPELIAPNLAKINAIFSRAYARLGRLHLESGQVRQARFWLRKAACHGRLGRRDAWLRLVSHLPVPLARALLARIAGR